MPVPGTPTVVRAPPLRATGMLNAAPRQPTEIELSPPLAKLKRDRAQAGGASNAKTHGNQRLLTQ